MGRRASGSYTNQGLDGRMVPVVIDDEVVQCVFEDRYGFPGEFQRGERVRGVAQLLEHLLCMVVVDVHVAAVPYELTRLQPHLLDHYEGQQRV